jgi:NAD+--asparagine ADP-ribosyltransferase
MDFDTTLAELETINRQINDATKQRDVLTKKLVAEFSNKYPTIYVTRLKFRSKYEYYRSYDKMTDYYLTKEEARRDPKLGHRFVFEGEIEYTTEAYPSKDLPEKVIGDLIQVHRKNTTS